MTVGQLRGASSGRTHERGHAFAQKGDGLYEFRLRERGDVHLETEPRDAAESGAVFEDFLRDFIGAADEDDGRGGVEEIAAVMLTDAKVVEPDGLGVGDARDEIAERGGSVAGEVGAFLAKRGGETVEADFDGRARDGFHEASQKDRGLKTKGRFRRSRQAGAAKLTGD